MSTQYLTHRVAGLEATPLAEYSMMNIQHSAGYPQYPIPGRSVQQNSGSLSLPNPTSNINGSPVSPRPNFDARHGPPLADDQQYRNGARNSPPQSPRTGHQWSSGKLSSLPPTFHPSEPQASSSRRPPAPQEPKVNSGDPYAMTASPRFGPNHNYSGGYQRGQHGENWGYGTRGPPASSPLSSGFSHGQEYGDNQTSASSPYTHTPGYAPSTSTPTSAQFPPSRTYSESHQHPQHLQHSQNSTPTNPKGHNYQNYESASERYHLPAPSFEPSGHSPHPYAHTNTRGSDLAPHTPSSGTISPHVSHGEVPRLEALANASIKDPRTANTVGNRSNNPKNRFQPPPPPQQQQRYQHPSQSRASSFSMISSQNGQQQSLTPYDDERSAKRPRIDTGPTGRSLSLTTGTESAERRLAATHESMSATTPMKTTPKYFDDQEHRDSRSPSEQSGHHNPSVAGIPFNREWGWTKGGKPRQRLPLACLSCRHKKIRCKPSEVKGEKCTHCTKMNLDCQYGKKEPKARAKDQTPKATRKASSSGKTASASAEPSVPSVTSPPMRMVKTEPGLRDMDTGLNGISQTNGAPDNTTPHAMKMESVIPKTEAVEVGMEMETPRYLPESVMIAVDPEYPDVHMSGQASGQSIPAIPVPEQALTPQMSDRTPVSSFVQPAPLSSISSPTSTLYGEAATKSRGFSSKSSNRSVATPREEPKTFEPLYKDPRHKFLPDKETLLRLVQLYFTHVYSQTYAFLHKPSFLRDLYESTPYKPVLLLALCAVAARFDTEQKKREELYAQAARTEILNNFDANKLEVVQAMLIMGLHDFGSANGDKAWMFCGMAVRMGAALNLNLPVKPGIVKPFVEAEVERRTYWSYYLMDRFNGYGVARPFLTQDDDCQIQLPCDQVAFEEGIKEVVTLFLNGKNPHHPDAGTEHMGAMAFLVRITAIWGKILKTIHFHRDLQLKDDPKGRKSAEFHRLRAECFAWDESLPEGLRYCEHNIGPQIVYGTVGSFVMMHVMFHASMIYLYRYLSTVGVPAEEVIREDDGGDVLVRGIRGAFLHGDAVLQIVEHVRQKKEEAERLNPESQVIVIAPFLGHIIKESCEVSLRRLSFIPSDSKQAEKQRKRVLCGLLWVKELKRYWKPLEPMADKLERMCRPLTKRKKSSNSPATSKHSPSDQFYNTFSTTPEVIHQNLLLPTAVTSGGPGLYNASEPIHFWDSMLPERIFQEAFSDPQALFVTAQNEFSYYNNQEYPFDIDYTYSMNYPGPMDAPLEMDLLHPVGLTMGHDLIQTEPYSGQSMEEVMAPLQDERCSVDRELYDDNSGSQSDEDTVEGGDCESNEKDAHMYFSLNRAVGNAELVTESPTEDRGQPNGDSRVRKRGSEGMPLKMLLNDVLDYIGPNSSKYERKNQVEATIKANAEEEKTVTNAENITKEA